MGVPGLWDLIQHTSETRSLTHLAVVDGFEKNVSGLRGYRVGIDASIWFFHAQSGREGENPELRLIFFRLAKLLSEPFLPLFVFDGPKRPGWKRGIQISKKPHWMIHGVKTMINAFGFEWRQAPGEAEAELSYLNRVGVIDGILSDDVDNFLFGALTVIRNPGRGLTGNLKNPALNAEGKDDGNHVRIFTAAKIASDETAALNRAGFILIGLLSGGDYEEKQVPGAKLNGCGMGTAHALARCGFGEELVNAFKGLPDASFTEYLVQWRDALRAELCTNSRGYLPRKQVRLANSVSDAFPSLKVLRAYVEPVTSESEARLSGVSPPVPQVQWKYEHSLAALARFCEEKFEWGTTQIIPKRFRSLLWHGSVIRVLRRAMLDLDRGEGTSWKNGRVKSAEEPLAKDSNANAIPHTPRNCRQTRGAGRGTVLGTPSKMITKYFGDISLRSPAKARSDDGDNVASTDTDEEHPLIANISSSTTAHPQTDFLLEYRVELDPHQLVLLTHSGIEGVREEPAEASDAPTEDEAADGPRGQKRKPKAVDPFSLHRIWVPALMLRPVEKDLVSAYEAEEEAKRTRKSRKTVPKGKRTAGGSDLVTDVAPTSIIKPRLKPHKVASARARAKKAASAPPIDEDVENFDLAAVSDASDSDACGGPTTSKPPIATTAPRKATVPRGKVRRHRATSPKMNSDPDEQSPFIANLPQQRSTAPLPSKPTKTKAAGGPAGVQCVLPAQNKPKTSHSSLVKALDVTDWDDLFPPAPKAPIPSGLPPPSPTHKHQPHGKSKVRPAGVSSPPKRPRRQIFTDSEEDPELAGSTEYCAPKSPRKSKDQVSPSRRKEKIASPKLNQQGNFRLPSLSSSSESEDDDTLARNDTQRAGSPTPQKGATKDAFRALWDKVGATRQVSKKLEIVDVSSEEDGGVVSPEKLFPEAEANDKVATLPKGGDSTTTVPKLAHQSRLPFRPVKAVAAKKPAMMTHHSEDGRPTQRNKSAPPVLDVIDLTTP